MKKNIQTDSINVFISLVILSLSMFSCKKLIVIPPNAPNQIANSQVFADSLSIMSAIAGVYNNFSVAGGSLEFNSGLITTSTGLSGDELQTSITYNRDLIQFYGNNVVANNGTVSTLWTEAYHDLYQINDCIAGISTTSAIGPGTKNQLLGELKVVRALYYFNLVNLYNGVPLVLSTDYNVTQKLPRASVDAVYTQIIADLTDATKKLNPSYPSDGRARPNIYTAEALLAKVYLYRGLWANAAAMASAVINSQVYSLEPDLNNVFLDGSSEAIWQLPAISAYNQTAEASTFVPYSSTIVPSYYLTNSLLSSFETGDLRKQDWTATNRVILNHSTYTYYYPYKYKNLYNDDDPAEDYMILRLGEQFLIRAEALAQQGNTTAAIADLNMIRNPDRVGLAGYAGPTDQVSVLSAIMRERRTELFCEWGNRWFDLKRTGTAAQVLGAEKSGFQPNAALYPIPITEIQKNVYLTQNPGY